MNGNDSIVSDVACFAVAAVFVLGLFILGVRLKDVQVNGAAGYSYAKNRQSVRRVQTAGPRGRILDRAGRVLAENRRSLSVVCNPSFFQRKTWSDTEAEIGKAVRAAEVIIGRPASVNERDIRRHVRQSLAMPLTVWRDIQEDELARFSEHEGNHPGFSVQETDVRTYPQGRLAAHLLGYVGRDRGEALAGDENFNFYDLEMRGRSGVEIYYDSFLRGVSGEKKVLVDARGFAIREWTVVEAQKGPDLQLALDSGLQRVVERELRGECGACVVMDSRSGEILALASAPGFDPNDFVPVLPQGLYARYAEDRLKPLLNRAAGGAYAPGSIFKPITALAGLSAGWSAETEYECSGVFALGAMKLHCARRWGHGPLGMRQALRESCNAYFCHLGMAVGTNALIGAANAFGLGAKTGVDFGVDMAGTVPDGAWKQKQYNERWYPGDLAQMSIGQGMLLVSPLQMVRVAGALGTGFLLTPHVKRDVPAERQALPFAAADLAVVREGMRMVVDGGTGRRGAEGVDAHVIGKTGTAEVGRGAARRKNTWFIAHARGVARADRDRPVPWPLTEVAVALVIENGQSGGGTAAPRVRNVLAWLYGEREPGVEN